MECGAIKRPGVIEAKRAMVKYDATKHAKVIARDNGVCSGPIDCDICFRKTCGSKFIGCSPEDAYEDALKFLGEKDNRGKFVSIW